MGRAAEGASPLVENQDMVRADLRLGPQWTSRTLSLRQSAVRGRSLSLPKSAGDRSKSRGGGKVLRTGPSRARHRQSLLGREGEAQILQPTAGSGRLLCI